MLKPEPKIYEIAAIRKHRLSTRDAIIYDEPQRKQVSLYRVLLGTLRLLRIVQELFCLVVFFHNKFVTFANDNAIGWTLTRKNFACEKRFWTEKRKTLFNNRSTPSVHLACI